MKTETGSLSLTKAVEGDADPDQEFVFNVYVFSQKLGEPKIGEPFVPLSDAERDEKAQAIAEFFSGLSSMEDMPEDMGAWYDLHPDFEYYALGGYSWNKTVDGPVTYKYWNWYEDEGCWGYGRYLQITLKAGETVTIPDIAARSVYIIEEQPVEGYVTDRSYVVGVLDDYVVKETVTNIKTSSKTTHRVEKIWEQPENEPDQSVPVQVQLTADGKAQGAPVTLNAENEWTYTWTELPMFTESGDAIVYAAEEVAVPAGFTAETETKDGVTTITNSLSVEISGTKTWDDSNDRYGKRPASITVRLKADGVEVASVKVTAAEGWKYTFKDQPKNNAAGKAIVYTVTEDAVPGYTTRVSGYNITNTYQPRRFFSPRTGDGNQPMLWLGLALLSGLGVLTETARRKRKTYKSKH